MIEWEQIAQCLYRIQVPGGWLYKLSIPNVDGLRVEMKFVPDPGLINDVIAPTETEIKWKPPGPGVEMEIEKGSKDRMTLEWLEEDVVRIHNYTTGKTQILRGVQPTRTEMLERVKEDRTKAMDDGSGK